MVRAHSDNDGSEQQPPQDVTRLLQLWKEGDASAFNRLVPLVYAELHRLASMQMASERRDHVLQPSALVNEAFLRLMGHAPSEWASRSHFYGVSARLMRQILVDFARSDNSQKRGARTAHLDTAEASAMSGPLPSMGPEDLIAIDEALKRLEELDTRQAKVVELRFFGGLDNAEIARVLNVSEPTVVRDWRLARAWLFSNLASEP